MGMDTCCPLPCLRSLAQPKKSKAAIQGPLRHRRQSADSVEKLLFRSYSKSSRAAEASLLLGRGEPCNLLLRATRTVLTSAATIRRVNCREQRTLTRIRSMCILEFFNRIDQEPPFVVGAPFPYR